MTRRRLDPLRPLTRGERADLERLSRSQSAAAGAVVRARMLLAVVAGCWHVGHGGMSRPLYQHSTSFRTREDGSQSIDPCSRRCRAERYPSCG